MRTNELPAAVLERYSTRQSVCFCGVLPEIGRAWATVDNALFLWRFDEPGDVPVEYSGEEQAIVAIGLATPKPGVFLDVIEKVLVVATTVEIVLLGVTFEGGDGRESAGTRGEMTLHPLQYACVTDDVVVKDIAATETGRIFFVGDDEALYEVEYSASDTWRSKKCRKTCHHSAVPRLLPSILRLRTPDPLKQVLVDEYRCALYTRSEAGVVTVYDLGPGCTEAPRKVAECRDVAQAAVLARGGGGLFYMGGGMGGRGMSGAQGSPAQRGGRLVHLAVVSPSESTLVTLVAVCADGRRVYFTTLPAGAERMGFPGTNVGGAGTPASQLNGYAAASHHASPGGVVSGGGGGGGAGGAPRVVPAACRLAVVQSREPLPQGSAQRGMTSAQALRATTTVRPLQVEAAYYFDGLMLLSDAGDRDEDARLFLAARDLTLPPHLQVAPANVHGGSAAGGFGLGGGNQLGGYTSNRSMREIVTPQALTGRVASSVGSMGEVPPPLSVRRDLAPPYPSGSPKELALAPRPLRSELATQHVAPRRRFVIVTNAGVIQLEKTRPLDALCTILAGDVHEQLAHFFKSYGQAEAATMCLALAVGSSDARAGLVDPAGAASNGGGVVGSVVGSNPGGGGLGTGGGFVHGYTASLAERARRALEDPRLTGEPHVDDDVDALGHGGAGGGQPFDMGRPIVQPMLHYSGVHRACFTFAARLLASTWDRPLFVPITKGPVTGQPTGQPTGGSATGRAPEPRAGSSSLGQPANGSAGSSPKVGIAATAAGWLGGMLGGGLLGGGPGNHQPAACTLPPDVLASLERRLRPLGAFLAQRRPRVAVMPGTGGRGSESAPGRAVGLHPPARQRRRIDGPTGALRAEERSLASLRGLLARTVEAVVLLRVLQEHDVGRLAGYLAPEHRTLLQQMSLRRLASTAEGARLASALVEALMAHVTRHDRDAVDAVAARLQSGAPLFFGGDERTFYRARELLQAARDARDAGDTDVAAERAATSLGMLLTVPLAGDPTAVCAELADLRVFHGLVALPLAAAAAAATRGVNDDVGSLGPTTDENMTNRDVRETYANGDGASRIDRGSPSSAGELGLVHSSAPASPGECFEVVCVALRALATGAADPGAPPGSMGAVCAALPAGERAAGLAAVLERIALVSSSPAAAVAAAEVQTVLNPGASPTDRSTSAAMARATAAEVAGAALEGGVGFVRRVYVELERLGRDAELLSLPAGPLEAFLAERGAFTTAQQGGALTQEQARHLELLARLYAARERHGLASRVFFALAERRSPPEREAAPVPLEERGALLDLARRHATREGGGEGRRSGANGFATSGADDAEGASLVETLDGKIRVLGFQMRLRATFRERARVAREGGGGGALAGDAEEARARHLERELLPLSDQYNDFARPAEMWDLCLEMLHFSRYHDVDGAVARQLWESLLTQAAASAASPSEALVQAAATVRALGPKLFPSEQAFPLAHVALRLELLAAGLWGVPEHAAGVPVEDRPDAVAEALLAATGDSPEAVYAAYDRLLATPRGAPHGADGGRLAREQHLQTPAVRLRLLRSALRVLRRWDETLAQTGEGADDGIAGESVGGFAAYGASRAHVRAALGDVCVGYAGEARRLLQVPTSAQGAAEALAADFDALGKRLIG